MGQLHHVYAIAEDMASLIQTYRGNVKAIHKNKGAIGRAHFLLDLLPKIGYCPIRDWNTITGDPLMFGQVFLSRELHPENRETIFEFIFAPVQLRPGKPSLVESTGYPELDLLSGLVVSGGFYAAKQFFDTLPLQDIQLIVQRYNDLCKTEEQLLREADERSEEFQNLRELMLLDSVIMRKRAIEKARAEGREIYEI